MSVGWATLERFIAAYPQVEVQTRYQPALCAFEVIAVYECTLDSTETRTFRALGQESELRDATYIAIRDLLIKCEDAGFPLEPAHNIRPVRKPSRKGIKPKVKVTNS